MKNFVIKIIRFYQKNKSPRNACCRFVPTCSEYMILAVEKYGLFKGFFKGVWRFLRCNPFNRKHGIDYP